jgi:hypothetical protein
MPGSPSAALRPQIYVVVALFVITCTAYLLAKVNQVSDSRYSLLVSESLLHRGRVDLTGYIIPGVDPSQPPPPKGNGAYQLEQVGGRTYYYFPVGTSVLSTPFTAIANAIGLSCVRDDGTYDAKTENRLQLALAALLMAVLTCLIFLTARLRLPLKHSLLVAVGCAFGTQMASTASRALWSDTWGILLLGFVAYMLLSGEQGSGRIRPVLLATLLSWAYIVRPTNSIPILGCTIYIFLYYRPLLARYALTGGIWAILFATYSFRHFGQLLPNYYLAERLTFSSFGGALVGNLVSPSRGILVFIPMLIFVAYLVFRYRVVSSSPRLSVLCLGITAVHVVVVSGFPHWWGGHSFGPRLLTGLIPWLALLAILALQQWGEAQGTRQSPGRLHKMESAVGLALLLLSVAIHVNGAANARTYAWNATPVDIDKDPSRLWDWAHPQFLAR